MGDKIQQTLDSFSSPTSGQSIQDTLDSYATPSNDSSPIVKTALSDVGDQSYNGYCQAFVEQVAYGNQKMFPTAVDAWNNYTQNGQGVSGTQGIKPGDIVYFTPNTSNANQGHTGIYQGDNKFISATDTGVQSSDLNEWQKGTGQQILGYVPVN